MTGRFAGGEPITLNEMGLLIKSTRRLERDKNARAVLEHISLLGRVREKGQMQMQMRQAASDVRRVMDGTDGCPDAGAFDAEELVQARSDGTHANDLQ